MNSPGRFAGGGSRMALKGLASGIALCATAAFGGMTAVRSIDEGSRAGGGNAYGTTVTVSVEDTAPSAMILQEDLPEGWTVESATWNGTDFMPRQVSGGTNKWLFGLGTAPGAGTLRYVTRTAQAVERAYAISGNLAYLDGNVQVVAETAGDAVVLAMDGDSDGIPDDWEVKHYGTVSACDAKADTDGDGMTALDEFVAGSDPTDGKSFFGVGLTFTDGEPVVSWMPDLGTARSYMVEGRANLPDEGVWSAQTTPGMRFFRVRVGLPE